MVQGGVTKGQNDGVGGAGSPKFVYPEITLEFSDIYIKGILCLELKDHNRQYYGID